MASEVAERYAEGLFSLALEDHTAASKKQQAEELSEVLAESDDLLLFLRAVKITPEEKKKAIDEMFSTSLDHDFVSFLKLLVDKDRTYYLKEILNCFIDRCDEHLGIQKAEVLSARPLCEEDMKRIAAVLEKQTGKKIVLKNKIDTSLIAGIKVRVGSRVTDVSMKSRIENMKEALLKGGRA